MRPRTQRPALEQRRARACERGLDLLARFRRRRHHLVDAARGVEEILVDELVLRVERRVAVRQHAVADAEDLGILAEHLPDLLVAPDIEGAFHLVRLRIVDLLRRN